MKKVLFVFLMMILVPIVQAEEFDSCFDDYVIDISDIGLWGTDTFYKVASDSWDLNGGPFNFFFIQRLFPVEASKTYYLRVSSNYVNFIPSGIFTPHLYFYYYDSEKNLVTPSKRLVSSVNVDYTIFSFEIPSDVTYSYVSIYFNSTQGFSDKKILFSDKDLSTCPEIPINPDTPDEPVKPSETDEGKILTNFYTLFIDKVKFICNYATNSPLFLAFIGIFILFFVLKMFLYLFNKGGYR